MTQPGAAGERGDRRRPLFGGGTDGNEQLTAVTGALLLVLLAVLGVTIIRIGQLLWLHLFLGLLLVGPVVLKLASTGYRFVILLLDGPGSRGRWLMLHKITFFVWIATMVPHVLGHLLELPGSLRAAKRADRELTARPAGDVGRAIALASALVMGLVLAIVLLPDFAAWTSATLQHHHPA